MQASFYTAQVYEILFMRLFIFFKIPDASSSVIFLLSSWWRMPFSQLQKLLQQNPRVKINNNKHQKINIVIQIISSVPMRILKISQSPYDSRCLLFNGNSILATMPFLKFKHYYRQVFNIIGPIDTPTRSFWN
jgi:hypothetical protein